MTASSSDNDLADLLGSLADNDHGIDEETLAEIDNPAAKEADPAFDPNANSGTSTDDDETTVDAHAEPGDDLAAIAAAAASEASADVDEEVAEAVFDTEEDAPEAIAVTVAVDDAVTDDEYEDAVVDETEEATEADVTAAAEAAAHEIELQEGVEALEAVSHGETLAEESEEMEQFAAMSAPAVGGASGAAGTKRRTGRLATAAKGDAMKATMAPILLTVGMVVLIPAVWGTLLLMGVETFGSDRSNAKTMATFMLLCWPISIALIVTAIILFLQISKAKKKAAAREARG